MMLNSEGYQEEGDKSQKTFHDESEELDAKRSFV